MYIIVIKIKFWDIDYIIFLEKYGLFRNVKNSLEQNKKLLEDLQQDEESKKNNKKQINQVKKEIKSLESSIKK